MRERRDVTYHKRAGLIGRALLTFNVNLCRFWVKTEKKKIRLAPFAFFLMSLSVDGSRDSPTRPARERLHPPLP